MRKAVEGLRGGSNTEQRPRSPDIEAQERTSQSSEQEEPHYLKCLPQAGERRPLLFQIQESAVHGDRDYFDILEGQARIAQGSWMKYVIPRRIKAIEYSRVSRKI